MCTTTLRLRLNNHRASCKQKSTVCKPSSGRDFYSILIKICICAFQVKLKVKFVIIIKGYQRHEIEIENDEMDEERYGWGKFCPDFLQRFNSPKWATAFFCLASVIQGIIINGLLHYFLPTLERRFKLSSIEAGFLMDAYDIAGMLCVLPTTYLGGRRGSSRPLYIGCGMLIMGAGSIIFTLPAFHGEAYRRHVRKEICDPEAPPFPLHFGEEPSMSYLFLFVGNFLHGIGASPLYTLAVTYIDDNVPVKQASLYFGCYYMMSVVGPFLGNVIGGSFAQVNGEFRVEKIYLVDLTPESSSWIGCWWCGFVITGIFACLSSIPILGLPRQLPDGKRHIRERENLQDAGLQRRTFTSVSQLPWAIYEVLKHPKFVFMMASSSAELLIFSGMGGFLSKLLKEMFGLTATDLAIYLSIITIPSTMGGIYFGSSVIKLCRMGVKEILTLNVIVLLFSLPCGLCVFISCPSEGIVGISFNYAVNTSVSSKNAEVATLIADCNKDCRCDERSFSPVCGSDDKDYYSACFAGCRQVERHKIIKIFHNCTCIKPKPDGGPDAVDGSCTVPCPLFPIFVFLLFIYLFLSFTALIPTITAILRVVHSDTGSLALGLQWVCARAFGSVPGPILFGKAIDLSCMRWLSTHDGKTGNCILYDHKILSRNLGLMIIIFKLVSVASFCFALYLAQEMSYKRPSED